MAGDPVAVAVGINIASAAAYDFLRGAAHRKLSRSRSFFWRLGDFLYDQCQVNVPPETLEEVLFRPEVWLKVMVENDSSDWARLLFDIIPRGSTDIQIENLGAALRDGVARFAEADLRAAVLEAQTGAWLGGNLSLVSNDLGELKAGQRVIYQEQLDQREWISEIRESVNVLASRAGPPGETFAESIQDHMAQLQRRVRDLTEDQCRVIRALTGRSRVLVTGAAGSGKTLVAAEKAIRMSNAGLRVLFLCHNPRLADMVTSLAAGSGVSVWPFNSWICSLSDETNEPDSDAWTNMHEPLEGELLRAFEALLEATERFDAVVVDEAQDFRDEWWVLSQAALKTPDGGILYMFADDTQAILPFRARYPSVEVRLSLTRNCRNAGLVYDMMGRLCSGLPSADPLLADLGRASLMSYDPNGPARALESAIRWLGVTDEDLHDGGLALLSNEATASRLDGLRLRFSDGRLTQAAWRSVVLAAFKYLGENHSSFAAEVNELIVPQMRVDGPSTAAALTELDRELSTDVVPRPQDIALCKRLALKAFKVHPGAVSRESPSEARVFASGFRFSDGTVWKPGWRNRFDREHYHRNPDPVLCAALQIGSWAQDYSPDGTVRIARGEAGRSMGSVPVFTVAEFKGLEADAVLVLWDNTGPAPMSELLVAVSRARFQVQILVAEGTERALPPRLLAVLGRELVLRA